MIDARAMLTELHQLGVSLVRAGHEALKDSLAAAEEDAKATGLYKDRTGLLRRSTSSTMSSSDRGELRADTKYARYVEEGTSPHIIAARKAQVLRFVQNGQVRFAQWVRHPGTSPRPFMQHAADVGDKVLDYGAEYYADQAIQTFNSKG